MEDQHLSETVQAKVNFEDVVIDSIILSPIQQSVPALTPPHTLSLNY